MDNRECGQRTCHWCAACYSTSEVVTTLAPEMEWVSTEQPKGERMTRVTILFPASIAKRLRALADQQATPFTTLLRLWLVQRLEEEERKRERDQ